MSMLYARLSRYSTFFPLFGLILVACFSAGTPLDGTAGASSRLVNLDPGKFRCLESPVHETIILPSHKLKTVKGIVDYDGGGLAGVNLFLEGSSGAENIAFHELTSEDGSFSFKGIQDGRYHLSTCLSGWNVLLIELEVDRKAEDVSLSLPMTLS